MLPLSGQDEMYIGKLKSREYNDVKSAILYGKTDTVPGSGARRWASLSHSAPPGGLSAFCHLPAVGQELFLSTMGSEVALS